MKHCKLIVHRKSFETNSDLQVNPKDFPSLVLGDVVEIYHAEDEFSRLLLQVTSFKEDFQGKDVISVEESVARTFQLRSYSDVVVNKVDYKSVALDSVEVTFKDQYLGRSEMWRLKTRLIDTCVYIHKKLEFCDGTGRVQVCEMWCQGEKVACGVISERTKIVFRSSTAMVFVFIQMSSEMWEFDVHGDLYFEKAINGFLTDLFAKWKKNGSNHEVTIILFTRVFYKAVSVEEFPELLRECLVKDYEGHFYEDFYRVAVQNEKYEDWSATLAFLRRLFTDYRPTVLEYHRKSDYNFPRAFLAPANRGNFLEVLNISLNVFEKHYLERSLDRTGQLVVVISPGVGVFQVDRELTNITKQRIIDNGVGCDLVCIGEQPLHAVPLFKFYNKSTVATRRDHFSMPHWINLSFYMSDNARLAYTKFVPRIRLPFRRTKRTNASLRNCWDSISTAKLKLATEPLTMHDLILSGCSYSATSAATTITTTSTIISGSNSCFISEVNYETYDSRVFLLPSTHNVSVQKVPGRTKKISLQQDIKLTKRKLSDPDIYSSHLSSSDGKGTGNIFRSSPIGVSPSSTTAPVANVTTVTRTITSSPRSYNDNVPYDNYGNGDLFIDDELYSSPTSSASTTVGRLIYGGVASPVARVSLTHSSHRTNHCQGPTNGCLNVGRAFINPFDPSRITVKVTSNRRRWTHAFSKGPSGVVIQQHHYQSLRNCVDNSHPSVGSSGSCSHEQMSLKNVNNSGRNRDQQPNSDLPWDEHVLLQLSLLDETRVRCAHPASSLSSSSSYFSSPTGGSSKGVESSNISFVNRKIQTLLWGVTGEQKWIPTLTTYVDWKSLVIPACLPVTTDYFPDEVCLKTDYVFSDYNLLPDDVNADYARKRAIYREPLTTREVFNELVSQRLAQGFQLIVVEGESTSNSCQGAGSVIMPRCFPNDTVAECMLSIGRIFHKISLCKSDIRITRYKPRHPYPPFVIPYRYRFQAPDHNSYGTSWSSFKAEILENFNWNYLDHYICTRGDTDFSLIESCKYWRFRIYALPSFQPGTKIIMDGSQYCDVYTSLSLDEKYSLLDGFMRFMESPVNKIKRISCPKTTSKANSIVHGSSSFRDRFGSSGREKSLSRPRSGSKILEKSKISRNSDVIQQQLPPSPPPLPPAPPPPPSPPLPAVSVSAENDNEPLDTSSDVAQLKETVSDDELVELFVNPVEGVGFLSQCPGLPSNTFISYDAVQWFKKHVEGISSDERAIEKMKKLHRGKRICHASGDLEHPFIFGSYLYYIMPKGDAKLSRDHIEPIQDLVTFRNEWAEVETLCINPFPPDEDEPSFFLNALHSDDKVTISELCSVPAFKQTHLELDFYGKRDRIEWGHARYQSVYSVEASFELVIEWVAASGPVISDLIYGLARRAQTYNLQLVPIPADPHALPYALKSDPLRGPVFVPINLSCLVANEQLLFSEFPKESWIKRMLHFQERIALRFGFIPCKGNAHSYPHHKQFVHVTGNVFLLIVSPTKDSFVAKKQSSVSDNGTSMTGVKYNVNIKDNDNAEDDESSATSRVSPHQEYISRHIIDIRSNDCSDIENRNGYLWSWNHMIGRRWKGSNAATNDEAFQDKLLQDFRHFCSNSKGRLEIFWNSLPSQSSGWH